MSAIGVEESGRTLRSMNGSERSVAVLAEPSATIAATDDTESGGYNSMHEEVRAYSKYDLALAYARLRNQRLGPVPPHLVPAEPPPDLPVDVRIPRVYGVVAVGTRRVKIGCSIRFTQRLRKLRTVHGDLKVRWLFPGTRLDEQALHRELTAASLGYEWFTLTRRVIRALNREQAGWPLPAGRRR